MCFLELKAIHSCHKVDKLAKSHSNFRNELPLITLGHSTDVAGYIGFSLLFSSQFTLTLTFAKQISCEAIGFPAPYIRWFKDGEEIRDSVLPRRPRHYQRPRDVPPGSPGRSTVELQVLGTVDAGTYTCSAENPAARREVNFTLKVDPGSSSSSVQHAIVTEAGPANSTVVEGDAATLRCRVKSVSQPHIKWLKKLDEVDLANDEAGNLLDEIQRRKVVNIYTLNNGNEKYRVLDTRPDVKTANGEFLNELEIPEAEVTDSGMYICFVTNSGFGALTYKAAFLRVLPRALLHNNNINNSNNKGTSDRLLLALIVSLVGVTFIVGMVVIICVLRRSRKPPKEMPNSTSEVSRPIGPEEEDRMIQRRPFLMDNSTFKFEPASPSSLPPPPPLFPPPAAWSRTTVVYPARHYENPANVMVKQQQQQQQQQQPESPNQYEVPYSHLLQVNHHQQQLNSSGGNLHSKTNSSSSSNPLLQQHQQQQQHFGGHFPGRSSTFSPHNGNGNNSSSSFRKDKDRSSSPTPPPAAIIYPFRSHPYFQYLNDYET